MENTILKSIDTPMLFIKNNIMTWDYTVVQLSNVSYISTSQIEPVKFPTWTLVGLIMGMATFSINFILSICILAISGIFIYKWYMNNEERKKEKCLNIGMNSGKTFYILFKEEEFLRKVVAVLQEIFREGGVGKEIVSINIRDCKFGGHAKVLTDLNIGEK